MGEGRLLFQQQEQEKRPQRDSLTETFPVVVFLSSGVFEIAEAGGVQQGTKIVLHLKDDCKEFSAEDRVKGIAAGAASYSCRDKNTLVQNHVC